LAVNLHDNFALACVKLNAVAKDDVVRTNLRERENDAAGNEPKPNVCGVAGHGW
jgi:hypothetical protein